MLRFHNVDITPSRSGAIVESRGGNSSAHLASLLSACNCARSPEICPRVCPRTKLKNMAASLRPWPAWRRRDLRQHVATLRDAAASCARRSVCFDASGTGDDLGGFMHYSRRLACGVKVTLLSWMLSQLLMCIEGVGILYAACSLGGLAYGAFNSLNPAIASDAFGVDAMGATCRDQMRYSPRACATFASGDSSHRIRRRHTLPLPRSGSRNRLDYHRYCPDHPHTLRRHVRLSSEYTSRRTYRRMSRRSCRIASRTNPAQSSFSTHTDLRMPSANIRYYPRRLSRMISQDGRPLPPRLRRLRRPLRCRNGPVSPPGVAHAACVPTPAHARAGLVGAPARRRAAPRHARLARRHHAAATITAELCARLRYGQVSSRDYFDRRGYSTICCASAHSV